MTKLSRRAGSLSESVTLALNAKAKAIAAQGERVLRFGVGEPDFDTPEHIKEAARRAIDHGVGKYTPVPGTPALREAVAETFRSSGVPTEVASTIISCGAKHSLYNAIAVIADDGDEVVLPAPYWVSYPSMIQASGAAASALGAAPASADGLLENNASGLAKGHLLIRGTEVVPGPSPLRSVSCMASRAAASPCSATSRLTWSMPRSRA